MAATDTNATTVTTVTNARILLNGGVGVIFMNPTKLLLNLSGSFTIVRARTKYSFDYKDIYYCNLDKCLVILFAGNEANFAVTVSVRFFVFKLY
jgi:hypothetical protein